MTRAWVDHNTLNTPAFFVEKLSHAPPPRERVERFRWQYGVGPGVPFVVPEPMVMAPQAAAEPAASQGEDAHVPPAPPPEPLPPAAETPPAQQFVPNPQPLPPGASYRRPRHNLAWMFTPSRG